MKIEMSKLEKKVQYTKIVLGVFALGALGYVIYLLHIIAYRCSI